ncbi:MAG: hypothetical protein ACOX7R_07335 [Acetivibrionales bacterium]|jgi:hypothetical protein
MYDSDSRRYVFRQTSGKIWTFFYDDRLGICFSTLGKRNIWSNPSSLKRNVHHNFFAGIDDKDRFHILIQDKQGSMHYCILENNSFNALPILSSKHPSAYNKYFNLCTDGNTVHFFYVLQHKDSAILAQQTLEDGKIQTPKVIDYVYKNTCPYSLVYSCSKDIYVFYQSSVGEHLQMGYKKYIPQKKLWSEFTPVTQYQGNCDLPRAIAGSKDLIHICYQRRSSKQYQLIYQQKIPGKDVWSDEVLLHSSSYPFEEASILQLDENIIAYWVRDDIIFYCLSKDLGETWSKPGKYNFPSDRQLICVSYKSNNPYENNKVFIDMVPANFSKGLKMAFYQDIAESINNVTGDDLKNILTESIKDLKASVDSLKKAGINNRNEILKLTNSVQSLKKEIVKQSVKLSMLENEMNKVKNLNLPGK